jgi:predicted RNase H-like nuclease
MSSCSWTVVGFDSAWTDKPTAPGAVCAIRSDAVGRRSSSEPQLATFDQAIEFITSERSRCDVCIVALDQPTIVPNLTRMRPVDRVAASLISWLGGGVQPANRSKIGMFDDDAPIWRFKSRLDASDDAEAARSSSSGLFLIEVFPALALPSLEAAYFGRLLAPRYNPEKHRRFRSPDWSSVTEAVRRHAAVEIIPELALWAHKAGSLAAPKKADQDKLDAAICALVGLMWRTKPRTETVMIGDLETGYMIAPASSEVRSRLNLAALKSGVAVDGVVAVRSLPSK